MARQDLRRAREKTEWHSVVIFNEGLCGWPSSIEEGRQGLHRRALQTRKWQGQDGADRYSTEVVLQGFNSVLTMLDARGGGASAGAGLQEDDQGGYAPARQQRWSKRSGAPAGAKGGFDKPVDDEIPF